MPEPGSALDGRRGRARSAPSRRSTSTCRSRCGSTAGGSCTRSASPTRPTAPSPPSATTSSWSATRSAATPTRPGFAGRRRAESTRDGFAAEDRDGAARQGARLVGRDDRPGQGLRHRPLLRRLHEPARRLPRHDRAVVDRPGDRSCRTARISRSSPSRTWCAPSARSWTCSASSGWRRWPVARSAACRRFEWAILFPDQVDAVVAIASTHALHPQGMAWNAIAREAIMRDPAWQGGHYYGTGRAPDAGHGRGPHGRPRHVPVRRRRWTTSSAAACSSPTTSATRSPSRSSRSRATCATRPSSFVKRFDANTYLYTSRALTYFDLARQHGDGSLAQALEGRRGPDAADRVQLRLAVSAVSIGGDRGGPAFAG